MTFLGLHKTNNTNKGPTSYMGTHCASERIKFIVQSKQHSLFCWDSLPYFQTCWNLKHNKIKLWVISSRKSLVGVSSGILLCMHSYSFNILRQIIDSEIDISWVLGVIFFRDDPIFIHSKWARKGAIGNTDAHLTLLPLEKQKASSKNRTDTVCSIDMRNCNSFFGLW